MKKLISILAALLLVVLGHYADAAENGANDKSITILKDKDEKPKKESVNVTVADFQDFSKKTLDDRVVEFRRGNEYYTMIPLRDLWATPKRKEAFEVAQTFGEKLMKVWLKKTLNMRYGDNNQLLESEMNKLSADQIREILKQTQKNSSMPSAREIVAAASDAKDAVTKLKERAKFFVDFDDLINGFDQNQEEIFQLRGLQSLKSKAVPTAFTFVASFKVPTQFIEAIKQSRYLSGVSFLLKGTINFTVSTRPWYVVKRNLDTGVQTTSWYIESATQAWLLKDLKTGVGNVSGPVRLGAGLLWGDFNRMGDINGFVTGYSRNFGMNASSIIPSYMNISFGTISAVAETLTQGLDLSNFVKNGYFIMTKQFGFKAPTSAGHFDVGGVFNLATLTDRVSLNQDTLEDLLKVVSQEVPGSQVIVRKDQVEILIPGKDTKVEPKQEISPKPIDPAPLKGQDNVPLSH